VEREAGLTSWRLLPRHAPRLAPRLAGTGGTGGAGGAGGAGGMDVRADGAAEKVAVANRKQPLAAKAGAIFNQLRTG
jgi:hypothetical protein